MGGTSFYIFAINQSTLGDIAPVDSTDRLQLAWFISMAGSWSHYYRIYLGQKYKRYVIW